MRDFDRPLDPRGHDDARSIGIAMHERGFVPRVTLCSTARRARETLTGVSAHVDTGRVLFVDDLYSTDAGGYLAAILGQEGHDSLLVVGHNPMMEDLASALAPEGEPAARSVIAAGFPTAGLAAIRFDGSLGGARPGSGFLEAFLLPGDA